MASPRFLVDENLSVTLPEIARAAGFECVHVNHLGLRTQGDPVLLKRILDQDWTLVTNNWREFLARYQAKAPVHAGLVLIIAANGVDEQRAAFRAALQAITSQSLDLVNVAVFVEVVDGILTVSTRPWPPG